MIYLIWLLLKANTPFDGIKANELYKRWFFFGVIWYHVKNQYPTLYIHFSLRIICMVMENVIWYLILFVVNDVYDRKMIPI